MMSYLIYKHLQLGSWVELLEHTLDGSGLHHVTLDLQLSVHEQLLTVGSTLGQLEEVTILQDQLDITLWHRVNLLDGTFFLRLSSFKASFKSSKMGEHSNPSAVTSDIININYESYATSATFIPQDSPAHRAM